MFTKANYETTKKVKVFLKNNHKPVELMVDRFENKKGVIQFIKVEDTKEITQGLFDSKEVIGLVYCSEGS